MVIKEKNKKSFSGSLDRRDFICKSAMFCCAMNIPLAMNSFSGDDQTKAIKTDVNPVKLTTYCGLYCGACDIYQKRISQSGNELKKVLDAYNFSSFSNQVPGLEDYDKFYKVLNNIVMFFGQCAGCQEGGGPPQCEIRNCCREKGYESCAECSSFPCDKVKYILDSYPAAEDNVKEIKDIGLEKWSQKQQEKVNKGFRYSTYLAEIKK